MGSGTSIFTKANTIDVTPCHAAKSASSTGGGGSNNSIEEPILHGNDASFYLASSAIAAMSAATFF